MSGGGRDCVSGGWSWHLVVGIVDTSPADDRV